MKIKICNTFSSCSYFLLGLMAFSLAFGLAISMSEEEGKPVLIFFESFAKVIMRIVFWMIYLTPIGVCFLVAGEIIKMKDVADNFLSLGWYFATLVIGLLIHGGIFCQHFMESSQEPYHSDS